MERRCLRVAAVQMVSENGERDRNLARATQLVSRATQDGAKLVVLPELFSGGYWVNERAWDTAEPQDGPTEAWLRETARRQSALVGGSYLQASGRDFFNVFALATPEGKIAGRVPKRQPGSVEAYIFRGQSSGHVIATDVGNIGVGICYDNFFRYVPEAFLNGNADIAVMCFSAPTPQRTWYYRQKNVDAFRASYRHGAQNYARMLGIPAIQVNKSGAWKSALPAFFPSQDSKFDGQSEIADSDGCIVAELAGDEAVIVGDVTLDPARKKHALGDEYLKYGRWISAVPLEFKMYRVVEFLGAHSYRTSARRRAKAGSVSREP